MVNLYDESRALGRIGTRSASSHFIGGSHGFGDDELAPDGGRSYLFYIDIDNTDPGQLRLVLDAYSALHLPNGLDGEAFDDERWNAMQMEFYAPATRAGYRRLSAAARGLIAGYVVPLGGCARARLAWLTAQPRADAPWFLED